MNQSDFDNEYNLTKVTVTIALIGLSAFYIRRINPYAIANNMIDCYLNIKERYHNWFYDCHANVKISSVQESILVDNVHLRWLSAENTIIDKLCFKVKRNFAFNADDHIDLSLKTLGLDKLGGLTLSTSSPSSSELPSHNLVSRPCLETDASSLVEASTSSPSVSVSKCSSDEDIDSRLMIDIFYEYRNRHYLVTVTLEQDATIRLYKPQSTLRVAFNKATIYDHNGNILSSGDDWILDRINSYLGPNGDFHRKTGLLRLADLYLPELEPNVIRLELETDLGETMSIGYGDVFDINKLV